MEVMMIGEIKSLNNLIKRIMLSHNYETNSLNDITGQQINVIVFIKSLSEQNKYVFQRDIETSLNVRPSTATVILKTLEKKGYIKRVGVPNDARLKRVILTDKTLGMFEQIDPFIKSVNEKLIYGLTDEEINQFLNTTAKLKSNLEKMTNK